MSNFTKLFRSYFLSTKWIQLSHRGPLQGSWASENSTLFVFAHSCLFFQPETLNTGAPVNVILEASTAAQKKNRWLQISSCAGKCLFISQSLCKWFFKRDLLNPRGGCSHDRLEIPIFLLTAFSTGRKKKFIGETPNSSICYLYLFGFYSTPKKCASGIPITSGKSLKKQEIKAEQIKSCSHFLLPKESALKKKSSAFLGSPVSRDCQLLIL